MALAIKQLAQGQLAAAKGTIYTTPAVTQAIVKSITVVNSDTVARAVNLYVKRVAGTSRRIVPKDLSLAIGALLEVDRVITLEAGDLIEGDCAAATVADFLISGAENT